MPQILCSGEPSRPARPDRAIALGAALFISDLPGLSPEFDLVAVAESNPWAVIAAQKPPHTGVAAAWKRHQPLRRLVELDGPKEQWESELRRELSASGPPEHKEVVAYIAAACPDPTFARSLLTELRGHSQPVRSTRYAAFKRRGPLTAIDWMRLYTLIRYLSLPGQPSLIDAAARLGVDPRTINDGCQEVLAMDCRDARKGFGWKWAVEHALRLHGYVTNAPMIPLAFRPAYPPPPPAARGGVEHVVTE
jgi:hypothetical protein